MCGVGSMGGCVMGDEIVVDTDHFIDGGEIEGKSHDAVFVFEVGEIVGNGHIPHVSVHMNDLCLGEHEVNEAQMHEIVGELVRYSRRMCIHGMEFF